MSVEKVWNGYLPSREVGMPWLLQLVVLKKRWSHALAFIDEYLKTGRDSLRLQYGLGKHT